MRVIKPSILGVAVMVLLTATSHGTAAEAQVAPLPEPDGGDLLTDPDSPSEGYYWRLNDDHKIWYDPLLGTQTDDGPVPRVVGLAGQACTSEQIESGGCMDDDGICEWDATSGREWYEPDAQGSYHKGDFVFGRCAAVRVWQESGTVHAIARSGVRTTAFVSDAGCVECEASVRGVWNFSLSVQWLDALGLPIGDLPVHLSTSESCLVKSQLLGTSVYGDCRWAALGPENLSLRAPLGAAGFKVTVELVDDWEPRQRAAVECHDCLIPT